MPERDREKGGYKESTVAPNLSKPTMASITEQRSGVAEQVLQQTPIFFLSLDLPKKPAAIFFSILQGIPQRSAV